jgi:hypothetical protein
LASHFLDLKLLGSGSFGALLFQKFHLLLLRFPLRCGLLGAFFLKAFLGCGLLRGLRPHIVLLLLCSLLLLFARAFASASSEPS